MKKIILIVACLTLMASSSFAVYEFDPTSIGVGARPLGMGKAFVGLSDDGNAVFTNSAGLVANDYRLTSMAGNLMSDISYTVLGGSFKAGAGNVGLGLVRVSTTGILGMSLIGETPEATGENADYTNNMLIINYSASASVIPFLSGLFPGTNLRVGAGLKLISEGFTGSSDFDETGSGFDADLAAMLDITQDISGGIVAKNIVPGNNITWKDSASELPMTITPGVNWKLKDFNASVGLDGELIEAKGLYWHLGGEWWPAEFAAIRLGVDQAPSGTETTNNLSAGIGTKYKGFTFDYAYHTYEDVGDFTTHYFSIGYVGQ